MNRSDRDPRTSAGVAILAGGRAGAAVENLLSDLLPEREEAPFDEILLVIPPSDDRTFSEWRERAKETNVELTVVPLEWPQHFGEARQFAFERLTTAWRGYLDADDRFPEARKLRALFRQLSDQAPEMSAVALPHIHIHAGHAVQPVRFVRWVDGWRWHGAIHENLVSTTSEHPAVAFFPEAPVLHQATQADGEESLARNEAILAKAIGAALAAGDTREWNRLRCFGAMNAAARGDTRKALAELEQVYRHTVGEAQTVTIAYLAAVRGCEVGHVDGVGSVLEWAGRAIAAMPTQQGGWAKLLVAYVTQERWSEAVAAWAGWQGCEAVPQMQWSDFEATGLVPAAAALALAVCGDIEQAQKILGGVREEYRDAEPAKMLVAATRQVIADRRAPRV